MVTFLSIAEMQPEGQMVPASVKFITGRGLHSADGKVAWGGGFFFHRRLFVTQAKLKPAIRAELVRQDLRFQEDVGAFTVFL